MTYGIPKKAKRDAIEKDVITAILDHGITVYSIDTPCDLLCGYRGVTYLVEVKSGKNAKLTAPQEKFIAGWNGHYQIIRSVEEAISWAANVRKCGGIQFCGTINGESK